MRVRQWGGPTQRWGAQGRGLRGAGVRAGAPTLDAPRARGTAGAARSRGLYDGAHAATRGIAGTVRVRACADRGCVPFELCGTRLVGPGVRQFRASYAPGRRSGSRRRCVRAAVATMDPNYSTLVPKPPVSREEPATVRRAAPGPSSLGCRTSPAAPRRAAPRCRCSAASAPHAATHAPPAPDAASARVRARRDGKTARRLCSRAWCRRRFWACCPR
jgi:hypothetical protein